MHIQIQQIEQTSTKKLTWRDSVRYRGIRQALSREMASRVARQHIRTTSADHVGYALSLRLSYAADMAPLHSEASPAHHACCHNQYHHFRQVSQNETLMPGKIQCYEEQYWGQCI